MRFSKLCWCCMVPNGLVMELATCNPCTQLALPQLECLTTVIQRMLKEVPHMHIIVTSRVSEPNNALQSASRKELASH